MATAERFRGYFVAKGESEKERERREMEESVGSVGLALGNGTLT